MYIHTFNRYNNKLKHLKIYKNSFLIISKRRKYMLRTKEKWKTKQERHVHFLFLSNERKKKVLH